MNKTTSATYLCLSIIMLSSTALANDKLPNLHSADNQPTAPSVSEQPKENLTENIWEQDQLLGTMGGLRPWLGNYGISIGINETSEYLGNLNGGTSQGFEYDGLTTMTLQLDTKQAFNLHGGLFNVSALDIHGSNLSTHNLQTLQTASGIEANNSFRLWEAWYQQSFFQDQLDVKLGQQSLDQEFMVSENALLFVNTMFGWPMIPSVDMIGGGPAYPLSSPGVRLRVQPGGAWSALAGVFNDNPAGLGPTSDDNPQKLNRNGTNFRTGDKPLYIAEVQYSRPAAGDMEYAGKETLPGIYRLGGWYDAGQFADQRFGTDGLSLASPDSNGDPQLHNGNWSIYAVADQMIWRQNAESNKSVSFFFRGMGAPDDRNLINYSVNAGFTLKQPFESRGDDTAGLGLGYANVSNSDRRLDADAGLPIKRSGETFIEATYQYAVAPWWILQPDVQYVFNPGGGITNPNIPDSTKRLGDETVIGLRTNITF